MLSRLTVRENNKACRFPRLVLGTALLVCALSIYTSSTRLEYRTQRSDLISPHKDYQQRWRKYLAEFGDDDDIVVVVQGADRPRMEQALDTLAAAAQAQPQCFDRLFYRLDLRPLHNRALLYIGSEQIAQIQENLRSMSLLLEVGPFAWQSLTLFSLFHEARDRRLQLLNGE